VHYRLIAAALTAGIIITGCGAPVTGPSTSAAPAIASGRMATSSMREQGAPGLIYIASQGAGSRVAVYGGNPPKFVRAFSNGLATPEKIIFNSQRQLIVANYHTSNIAFYKANGSKPIRTLSGNLAKPLRLAVSSTNDLYAATTHNHTNIYFNSKQRGFKKIKQGAGDIVIDAANNAYLSYSNEVDVFAPGAIRPSRVITDGMNHPEALLLDSSGNLYVSNDEFEQGYVTVYNAATGALKYTITDGISNSGAFPSRMALDASGNLFVGIDAFDTSKHSATVTEYAAGTNSLIETISKGVIYPVDLLIDSYGNLFVANWDPQGGNSNVTVYAPGQTSPSETLTKGIINPVSFAWLPNK
jgi:hypothetical protein